MKNNRGFSLIEAVVGIGIVSVAALGLAHWLTCLSQGFSANLQNEGAMSMAEAVSAALGEDATHCTPNLQNLQLNPAVAAGKGLTSIGTYNDLGNAQNTVLQVGHPTVVSPASNATVGVPTGADGLTTNALTVAPMIQINPTSVVADLSVDFTKTGVFGPVHIVRHIPLYLTVGPGGKVQGCETAPISNYVMSSRLCEIWNDGFSYYDPVSGNCKDIPGVQWQTGSGASISCPAGYRFAAYPQDPNAAQLVCQTSGVPAGFGLTRNYVNGTNLNGQQNVGRSTLDVATNTCNFVFPAGGGGVPVSIKCYPSSAAIP